MLHLQSTDFLKLLWRCNYRPCGARKLYQIELSKVNLMNISLFDLLLQVWDAHCYNETLDEKEHIIPTIEHNGVRDDLSEM